MRRLLLTLLMMCMPLAALAEDTLYPAKSENGLYGYINADAEWVIPPQFDGASDFRGDYASVSMYLEGYVPDPDNYAENWENTRYGIIDRQGRYVLEPVYDMIDAGYDGYYYGGEHTGIWIVFQDGDDDHSEGFFDIPSGCFSGVKYASVWPWISNSQLIPVMGGEDFLAGYADRTTGELVIPYQYESVDPGVFNDGVASVSYVDTRGNALKYHLIDEKGDFIRLPDGISSTYAGSYSCGRIVIVDENERYGYADGQGNVVIQPQFKGARDFYEDRAAVCLAEGEWGYIDLDGNVIARGFEEARDFDGGAAMVVQDGVERYIGPDGQVLPGARGEYAFMDNGRAWMRVYVGEPAHYNARYHLIDEDGNKLTAEPYDLPQYGWPFFAEGLQTMENSEYKWGYINADGQVVIPFVYDAAENFDGTLAWVRLGDRAGYIDQAGNVVYMWDSPAEW